MHSTENRGLRLDRGQVIRTSLRLLDEVGLDGLTLRRLAGELDVQAPALYWHFANKQDLLDQMAHVLTRPWIESVPATSAGKSWDDWLTDVARSYRTLLLSHRDGAQLVASTRPLPESIALIDDCIAAFETSTGCGPGQAWQCLITIITFVRGFVLDEDAERIRSRELTDSRHRPGSKQTLEEIPRPAPHMDAAIAEIGSPNGEGTFEYGLCLIIDGIRVALSTRGGEA
jgi:TetR/AcrR family transcriptional regulator, tetracycline repressor protein